MVRDYIITTLFQKYCVLGNFFQILKVEVLQPQSLAKMLLLRVSFPHFLCVCLIFYFSFSMDCMFAHAFPSHLKEAHGRNLRDKALLKQRKEEM